MKHLPRPVALAAAAFLVLGTVGCGKVAEKAGEKIAENAIEDAAGGNADIDIDGGGVSIETDEGSYTADEEGNVRIETEDGTYEAGAGDVPDGWPSEIPLPDDLKVVTSSTMDGGTESVLSMIGTTGLEPEAAIELVTGALSGWETVNTYDIGGDGLTNKTVQLADGDKTALSLTASRNAGEDTTTITYTYTVAA